MRFLMCLLTVVAALCIFANACSEDVFDRQYDALNISELERQIPESAKENFSVDITQDFDSGLKTLWQRLLCEIGDAMRRGIKNAGAVLSVAALCSTVLSVNASGSNGKVAGLVSVAGALGIAAACTGSITTIVGMGKSAVEEIDAFSKALLPSLGAAAAACGAPVSAGAKYIATVMFGDILIAVVNKILFPLVYAYIAMSAADAAMEGSPLGRIANMIKWMVSSALKLSLTAFVSYLGISGILASVSDNIAVKGAKLAISGVVPIVGGVIAEAAETVIAGAAVMKNAIGVFGMLTVLSICLTPFLTITLNFLLFKLSAAIITPVVESRLSGLVESIGASFGMILGMTASCALVMFLSIISSMNIAVVV